MIVGAALFAAFGCGASEPAQALPTATEATGLVVAGEGWGAAASSLRLAAGVAHANEPAIVRSVDGKPPLEIVAQRSEWDLRERIARFSGDVVVRRGAVELRCAQLLVRYADADHIERVEASGGVEVLQAGRTARAEEASLEGATGRIDLTGDPRLSEGPNTLHGARIVLWLDDERATCDGAAGAPCRLVVDGAALGRSGTP